MILSEFYHHRLTSKTQFEPGVLELQGYPYFFLVEFYNITCVYVFEVVESNGDTFSILPPPVDQYFRFELDFGGQLVVVEF